MRKYLWTAAAVLAAFPAAARPARAPLGYDLPYCDEVFTYCLQIHSAADCRRLDAEARARGSWRLEFERQGYPETDAFTVSVEPKPGTADTYIEIRQFGCHRRQ